MKAHPKLPALAETVLCILAGTAIFFAIDLHRPFNLGDEGFQYLLSRSWARGESIFNRFQMLYPVGQHLWLGTFMRVFGEELWVLRLGGAVLGGAACAALFQAVRRTTAHSLGWPLVLAISMSSRATPKLLASALVFAVALPLVDRRRLTPTWLAGAALLAGLLSGWREDSAVLALAVVGLGMVRRKHWIDFVRIVLPLAVCGFSFWLIAAWARGEAGAFVAHLAERYLFLFERLATPARVSWHFPPTHLPRTPRELGHQVIPLLAFLPVAVYGGLLTSQALQWRRHRTINWTILVPTLVGVSYLPQFLWERDDLPHFLHHLPILLTVIAAASVALTMKGKARVAGGFLCLALFSLAAHYLQRRTTPATPYPTAAAHRIGATFPGTPPQWAGLPRRPGETLTALWWGSGWYVLEDIEPGTRFLSTFSRHIRTEASRTQLLEDIEQPTNRWVIVPRWHEPPRGVRGLLQQRYSKEGEWQGWQLWEHIQPGP